MATPDAKWLGVTIDRWVSIVQTVGVPSLFMGFVCLLAWKYIPPIVEGHVILLQRTGDTLQSMDMTLQQSNKMIEEVVAVEKETKLFMETVQQEHSQQTDMIEDIHNEVIP